MVTTRRDGGFSVTLRVDRRGRWRVATAYYDGSRDERATTAFEGVRR